MFDLQSMGVVLIIFGGGLSCFGMLHNAPAVSRWDVQLSCSLYLCVKKYLPLFRLMWLFGKSPMLIVLLIILFLFDNRSGSMVILFYIVIACAERTLKLALKRQRPFSLVPEVKMCQPRQPYDPSYPSGDVMRAWYLTFVLPPAFIMPYPFFFLLGGIALLVSLGRIAFGVHFLLDIIGGTGLGLLGAGFYLIFK